MKPKRERVFNKKRCIQCMKEFMPTKSMSEKWCSDDCYWKYEPFTPPDKAAVRKLFDMIRKYKLPEKQIILSKPSQYSEGMPIISARVLGQRRISTELAKKISDQCRDVINKFENGTYFIMGYVHRIWKTKMRVLMVCNPPLKKFCPEELLYCGGAMIPGQCPKGYNQCVMSKAGEHIGHMAARYKANAIHGYAIDRFNPIPQFNRGKNTRYKPPKEKVNDHPGNGHARRGAQASAVLH